MHVWSATRNLRLSYLDLGRKGFKTFKALEYFPWYGSGVVVKSAYGYDVSFISFSDLNKNKTNWLLIALSLSLSLS